jgi:hypothetical protein
MQDASVYSKSMCLAIMEIHFCYIHFSQIFKFSSFLSVTQFDFVLISALADLLMKVFSYNFLKRPSLIRQRMFHIIKFVYTVPLPDSFGCIH